MIYIYSSVRSCMHTGENSSRGTVPFHHIYMRMYALPAIVRNRTGIHPTIFLNTDGMGLL